MSYRCVGCKRPIPYVWVERDGKQAKQFDGELPKGTGRVLCFRCNAKERVREGR